MGDVRNVVQRFPMLNTFGEVRVGYPAETDEYPVNAAVCYQLGALLSCDVGVQKYFSMFNARTV